MDSVLSVAEYPAPAGVVLRAGRAARGVCPRCATFIVPRSRVVRLYRPEQPDSADGIHDRRTGRAYYATGQRIRMHPRWWIHERCARPGEIAQS